jgi:peptide/nickel transport system ATP-binding protein
LTTSPQHTALIKAEGLSIGFEGSAENTVKEVSFSIFPGKTLSVVGESGSGKSLTALSILQLLPGGAEIRSGKLWWSSGNGTPIELNTTSPKGMRSIRGKDIAMIFQEPMTALNPAYTCGEQLVEVLQHHLKQTAREAAQRAKEWFEKVKLPEPEKTFHKYPHQLSGGQRQRVMIAMAMCCNPKVLIADEPTTALDVTVQRAVLDLMKSLQREYNLGILFITHDLGVVNAIADEVLVMYKGEVVETGSAARVLNEPQHPYTRGLIGCRPPLNDKPHRLPTLSDLMNEEKKENEKEVMANRETKRQEKEQKPLLEVKGLSVKYVTQRNAWGKPKAFYDAVKELSFDLYEGETLGLVGESGCGKTTLGRSVLQLVQANSGSVVYKGVNLNELSRREMKNYRRKIQLIFQDPYSSLNPRITIGEAIMEPMLVHAMETSKQASQKAALELLDGVGLTSAAFNKYPHEFSGGQRQRVGIARALALRPELIICDESVSALDMSVQAQVLNLLNELKERYALTYLFISHDLAVVKYMSDRIMVMNRGEIEEEGDATAIYNQPKSAYTKKLIASIPTV